jgi:hypothetical protein
MSLYCGYCTQGGQQAMVVPEGSTGCSRCGRTDLLRCLDCNTLVPVGVSSCTRCARTGEGVLVMSRREAALPSLPSLPNLMMVPTVRPVSERYQGGSHGVEAQVTMPARDAAIMNELAALVPVLHVVAGRLTQFTGLTDHTRKLVRDLRTAATDAQEEIELRRGPA